jgi:hypothetical protein
MNKGFGMVEAVISVSIAASFILILSGANFAYSTLAYGQSNKIQASFLAEEAIEAVKFLRDESWDTNIAPLTPNTNYFPTFTGTDWTLDIATSTIGIFERKVVFQSVFRDANDNIVASGGTVDPDSRLLTVTVSWQEKGNTYTKVLFAYITDLFEN